MPPPTPITSSSNTTPITIGIIGDRLDGLAAAEGVYEGACAGTNDGGGADEEKPLVAPVFGFVAIVAIGGGDCDPPGAGY